jgi:hypothetical protein
MMIFRKAIPRRTFLRGLCSTVALPLLDAMVPALATAAETARPAVRFSIVFIPNGRIMEKWTPKTDGASFEMSPILEPLAAFRDRMVVLSGLASRPSSMGRETQGPHATASGWFLTGVKPKPPGEAGISIDQIVAKELGKHTQLASLELSLESGETGGGGDGADSDAYLNTISWRTATTPLPVENNPRAVFERLFGESDSTDPVERRRRLEQDRSVLDIVTGEVNRLMGALGPSDRGKLVEYLDGVRDVERRIQIVEQQTLREMPVIQRPSGMPSHYEEHAKLMFDLQVLAYRSDLTRVITFSMAREKSERAYREIGLEEGHHALTHHGNDPVMVGKCVQIEQYQSKVFSYFLEKMQSTPDGDGTLLDHTVILYAGSLGDGNGHSQQNLPVLLLGGAGGRLKGGRHVRYPQDTPLTNLFLSMLDMVDIPLEKFGDSTGELELLPVA